jgi:hypothetical protein
MTEPCGIDILVSLYLETRADFYKGKEPRSFERLEKLRGGNRTWKA